MITNMQSIYERMGDSLSGKIYNDRCQYSNTRKGCYIEQMVDRSVRGSAKWKSFCELLKRTAVHSEMYIFGAGIWGNILFRETRDFVQWSAVIDNDPDGKTVGTLPVISPQEVLASGGEDKVIVISSYKNRHEMSVQLQRGGMKQDKIIDAGTVIYWLTEGAVYFDLEQLCPQADFEFFVDAGCFDGLTTQAFFRWCKTKGYAYCFEPDSRNAAAVRKNLTNYAGQYELAEKALWSGKKKLYIDARGDCASSVRVGNGTNGNHTAAAVALDDYLAGKQVTYIKMDVEGAEAEVLKGARNTIISCRPRLAVSIYHKTEDIFVLPELILAYYSGYRFYMRHYSFSDYDTVLYAVP